MQLLSVEMMPGSAFFYIENIDRPSYSKLFSFTFSLTNRLFQEKAKREEESSLLTAKNKAILEN